MTQTAPRLGEGLLLTRMPAHWMLGRLGKRVMRPGGLGPSRWLIDQLAIDAADDVVELWPGLGKTAALALAAGPRSYTGVERGEAEAARARRILSDRAGRGADRRCVVAPTDRTGLPGACASVVYGEALLTLEPATQKARTVAEAARLLRPGGRYGVHELLLTPDGLSDSAKARIQRDLTDVLRVGARPLTRPEWRALLTDGGFEVTAEQTGPMLLLDPRTVLADEGLAGSAGILARSLAHPAVLPRLGAILRVFHRYRDHLGAIALSAVRRAPDSDADGTASASPG